ncbi:SWF or SNF family helicase [Streptomyces sp. GC420]|uniref:SWF or SNF family helicase n=1 Tax=Streptomyces sp. GC420 TaxID=2697568 RepID=UPI001414E0F5|nr:SWF or SNF family helicase [Streptomyces sp. GC420]NBM16071.1 SWF or SNF family helicase [Streptomyces sp. GC420]
MSGTAHGDERTFAALPPVRGRGFAATWWGRAWLKALEDTALDGEQLRLGRRLARGGAVGAVSVRPGRITAVVRDRDGTAHRGDVLLRELDAGEWDRLLGTVADRAGHIAALLDRDMPPHLVEDAAAAGVELLPGIGDLEPECDCGGWDHCGHTAALCYQLAQLLDQDPFVLLLLRGRQERELLDELQARSAAGAAAARRLAAAPGDAEARGDAEAAAGVPAAEVFAAGDVLPLPPPPPLPGQPGTPPLFASDAEPPAGLDVAALEFLAADTAVRAYRMLAEALTDGHELQGMPEDLTVHQDAARLAAAGPQPRITARLATGTDRSGPELALAARAWECGGPASLAVLEEEWTPASGALARARAALAAAWDEENRPRLRARANRWTVTDGPAQLRLGCDGRWWPYRRERGHWVPAGPPGADPASVLGPLLGGDWAGVE